MIIAFSRNILVISGISVPTYKGSIVDIENSILYLPKSVGILDSLRVHTHLFGKENENK